MEKLKELWDFLHIIIRRIVIYLKDLLVLKVTPYLQELRNFDKYTKKSQLSSSSKQIIADFAAFFIVCTLVGVILYISSKFSKNHDEEHINVTTPTENQQIVDLTEEEDEHNETIYELKGFKYTWANGPSGPRKYIPKRRKAYRKKSKTYCFPDVNNPMRHSEFSFRSTQSQHSQITRSKSRILLPTAFSQTWLIRRTRSGQIYGKYPI